MSAVICQAILIVLVLAVPGLPQVARAAAGSPWSALASTPAPTGPGASLASAPPLVGAPSDFLFATRGGGTTDFWRYNITADKWTLMANTPGPVGDGGAIVEADTPRTGFAIFALQGGGQSGFWEYNITANTWSTLQATLAPVGPGGSLTQLEGSGILQAFAGGGSADFWQFSIFNCFQGCTSGWKSLANAPGPVGAGGSLAGINYGLEIPTNDEFTVGLQGGGKTGYWLYDQQANSWSSLASTPTFVGSGGGVSTVNYDNGFFMAFAGGGSSEMFCFSNITGGSWIRGADFPVAIGPGGADTSQLAVLGQNGQNVPGAGEVFGFAGFNSTSFYGISTLSQTCPQFQSVVPPSASVSILSPTNGANLVGFSLSLTVPGGAGKVFHGGTLILKATIKPQNRDLVFVIVEATNDGGIANGSLTVTDNGNLVGTAPFTDFTGTEFVPFSVTFGLGSHTLTATLTLTNVAGSSSQTSTVVFSVTNTIRTVSYLNFTASGPVTTAYLGELTALPGGKIARSAQVFTNVALPMPILPPRTVTLQEPIQIRVRSSGTMLVAVIIVIDGNVQFGSAFITVQA